MKKPRHSPKQRDPRLPRPLDGEKGTVWLQPVRRCGARGRIQGGGEGPVWGGVGVLFRTQQEVTRSC